MSVESSLLIAVFVTFFKSEACCSRWDWFLSSRWLLAWPQELRFFLSCVASRVCFVVFICRRIY